jgi:hypothetical protein
MKSKGNNVFFVLPSERKQKENLNVGEHFNDEFMCVSEKAEIYISFHLTLYQRMWRADLVDCCCFFGVFVCVFCW